MIIYTLEDLSLQELRPLFEVSKIQPFTIHVLLAYYGLGPDPHGRSLTYIALATNNRRSRVTLVRANALRKFNQEECTWARFELGLADHEGAQRLRSDIEMMMYGTPDQWGYVNPDKEREDLCSHITKTMRAAAKEGAPHFFEDGYGVRPLACGLCGRLKEMHPNMPTKDELAQELRVLRKRHLSRPELMSTRADVSGMVRRLDIRELDAMVVLLRRMKTP